jgi:pimeloyl-ACP methyl ester carboxylesterase
MEDSVAAYADALLEQANADNIPSGILHWSYVMPFRLAEFDGGEWRGACDQPLWRQLYHELHGGRKREFAMPSLSELRDLMRPWHERDDVPIGIACFRYDTPKRSFVAKVISTARANAVPPQPESAERILEQKTAFFASALLPDRSHGFEFLPYEHSGLDVPFVVPRALFLSNIDGEPSGLEIDFDDGEGFRAVAFDERVLIRYGDAFPKQIRLRVAFGGTTLGASFGFHVDDEEPAPEPNDTWLFTEAEPYEGVRATGIAWVYYRTGGSDITNPMIFADGFGSGSTKLDDIWRLLNKAGLATALRDAGKDLIILGYTKKDEYVQANAMVAVECIDRTIRERKGSKPLVVAGGSMGGLVTRYALLHLEGKPRGHQTSTYLSYDTPHDGAWLPLILQHFAYYFELRTEEAERMVALIRSRAAQQMLIAWWSSKDDHGENSRGRKLRDDLNAQLEKMGNMPKRPRKYAVTNGTSSGVGNGVPAGARAFNWEHTCVGARPETHPEPSATDYLGELWTQSDVHKCRTKFMPPAAYDGAPGGMSDSFARAAKGAECSGWGTVTRFHDKTCFIPTVSALALRRNLVPYTPISKLPPGPFDEWKESSVNTMHVDVTPELRDWVVSKCAPKEDEEPKSARSDRDKTRDSAASP